MEFFGPDIGDEICRYVPYWKSMAINIDSFIAGYRQGHDGLPPTVSDAMAEHENEDLESTKPNVSSDPDWAWHLIGRAVGQAVARNETLEMG